MKLLVLLLPFVGGPAGPIRSADLARSPHRPLHTPSPSWHTSGRAFGAGPCSTGRESPASAPFSIGRTRPGAEGSELDDLRAELRQGTREQRRSAVRKVAKLATTEAFLELVGLLGDDEGMVADEAQFRLEGVADPEVREALLKRAGLRSKSDEVRERAAALLGRLDGPLDVRELTRALSSGPHARSLCASVERLARRKLLVGDLVKGRKALLSFGRARSPDVRAAALCAAGELWRLDASEGAGFERELAACARHRDPVLRCAALQAVRGERRCTLARELIGDEERAVRLELAHSLGDDGSKPALRMLCELLERDARSAVRWAAVDGLRRASGLRHRDDPRPWRDWIERLSDDWSPLLATTRADGDRGVLAERSKASLAGLPILGERIVFVVDFSGSLWMKQPDGTIKKEYADAELKRALASLSPDSWFNLIAYTGEPHVWQDKLVRATPRNVRAATEWFVKCNERGSGDFHEAACKALEDEDVQTVVVFTDGVPTGGRRWRLELLIPDLLERVRFRKVSFGVLLVDAPFRLHRLWRELAEQSGGNLVSVETR